MTKEEILLEVAKNKQPEFAFTTDLDVVVDSILQSREDSFLELNNKVKEIIEKEIFRLSGLNYGRLFNPNESQITFVDVCNWQKELFKHKQFKIQEWVERANFMEQEVKPYEVSNRDGLLRKITNLPDTNPDDFIFDLRNRNVTVGNWTPPHPMFLEDLRKMCFPVSDLIYDCMEDYESDAVSLDGTYKSFHFEDTKQRLLQWYKIFITIQFFEDFNEVLGMIVVNVICYALTGKYLIQEK